MNNKKTPTTHRCLYLDLDDCVADWIHEVRQYLDVTLSDPYTILPSHYQLLKDHDRFYRNLALMPNAIELVNWATKYAEEKNYFFAFLTAIPHTNDFPFAQYDKVLWANERFPGIPVFFGPYSTDKWKHCKPGDILIDDRKQNCDDWINAGGIAHQYTNWQNCMKWINDTLD